MGILILLRGLKPKKSEVHPWLLSYFFHVSDVSVCIFVALYLCIFVALYVRMFVAKANKVEGTVSWCLETNEIWASI